MQRVRSRLQEDAMEYESSFIPSCRLQHNRATQSDGLMINHTLLSRRALQALVLKERPSIIIHTSIHPYITDTHEYKQILFGVTRRDD